MDNIFVFYHADLDGLCSAAIVAERYPEIPSENYFKINYGYPIPLISPGQSVIMVDFCIQPIDQMCKLINQVYSDSTFFCWIDHHQSSIDAMTEALRQGKIQPHQFSGRWEVGKAGCELAWEYFFPNKPMPDVVRLLGRYDVWDHSDPDVVPFQYGMRCKNPSVNDIFWSVALNARTVDIQEWINEIISVGHKILYWENTVRASEYCQAYGIETFLNGHRAIALNTARVGSLFFQSTFSFDGYDIFISFVRLPTGRWSVSLMSDPNKVDVSKIAKMYGGGGHRGASGFQCKDLPFAI